MLVPVIQPSEFFFFTVHFFVCSLFIYFYFTILYWFCHILTWIHHGYTWVPNPEPPSHHPPYIISLGHPSALASSILYPVLNLDWWFISYMIVYMFQCHSPKLSHSLPLPQSPKVCSIHLCHFEMITMKGLVCSKEEVRSVSSILHYLDHTFVIIPLRKHVVYLFS